jgi:hypothetical protein
MSTWNLTGGVGSAVDAMQSLGLVSGTTASSPTATTTTSSTPTTVQPTTNSNGLTESQQSAFDILNNMLSTYGLGSLTGVLKNILLQGITDQNEISLKLQATDQWKQRFAGNEMLRQKGLPVLDVAQYLSVEQSYAQVLKNYGLPAGFYDDPHDFAQFIGNSVSANELQQRAAMYADVARREDPALKEQLSAMGLSQGDLLAYMMDPTRAAPLIQQKYQTALIGGAARRAGITPDTTYAQHLADLGISEQQASQGYGQIAQELPAEQRLGQIYKDNISQSDLESETFDGNGAVTAKKKRLASQERAAFSGSSGVGQGSLSRTTSGSY